MKTVVLAVLLFLAVASSVFGASTESGKSQFGDETRFAVILQTLHIYKVVPLLNYELRHEDVRKNGGKTPDILTSAPDV